MASGILDAIHSSLGRFEALPTGAKPVIKWIPQDDAFDDIAKRLRDVVDNLREIKSRNIASFEDEHSITIPAPVSLTKSKNRSLNKLPQKKRDDRSVGEKLQDAKDLIVKSFSIRG